MKGLIVHPAIWEHLCGILKVPKGFPKFPMEFLAFTTPQWLGERLTWWHQSLLMSVYSMLIFSLAVWHITTMIKVHTALSHLCQMPSSYRSTLTQWLLCVLTLTMRHAPLWALKVDSDSFTACHELRWPPLRPSLPCVRIGTQILLHWLSHLVRVVQSCKNLPHHKISEGCNFLHSEIKFSWIHAHLSYISRKLLCV